MTDLPTSRIDLKAVLSWLGADCREGRSQRGHELSGVGAAPLVTLYLPLSIIVIVLLFPFYWMALTAIKPDEQLLDLNTYNPFWTWNPTFKHIHKLLFESHYPLWLWNTMYVAVCARRSCRSSPACSRPMRSCACAIAARNGSAA